MTRSNSQIALVEAPLETQHCCYWEQASWSLYTTLALGPSCHTSGCWMTFCHALSAVSMGSTWRFLLISLFPNIPYLTKAISRSQAWAIGLGLAPRESRKSSFWHLPWEGRSPKVKNFPTAMMLGSPIVCYLNVHHIRRSRTGARRP